MSRNLDFDKWRKEYEATNSEMIYGNATLQLDL